MSKNIKNSVRALLSGVVDYAGLFPPAKLPQASAVAAYADYLKSEYSWMLGRYVVPVAKLDDFRETAAKFAANKNIWRLSAIAGEDDESDAAKIAEFNRNNEDWAIIDSVEIKVEAEKDIYRIAKLFPKNIAVYFEIPSSMILTDLIKAAGLTETRAKIRTGGITPEAFPPVENIVKFMRECIVADVPFKATAGLHHPLRCVKPLTYEENAPQGTMNGFLNLFLTAVFLCQNPNHDFVEELMNEKNIENFAFTDEEISWKNHAVTISEIKQAREKNIISFGSCSFTEPIEDLKDLNLLQR